MRRTQIHLFQILSVGVALLIGSAGRPRTVCAEPPAVVQPSTRTVGAAEAIRLAIDSNIGSRLAAAQTQEARGKALREAAGLLPKISAAVAVSRTFQTNLEAQGFP